MEGNGIMSPMDLCQLHSPVNTTVDGYQPLLMPLPRSKFTLSRILGKETNTPKQHKDTENKQNPPKQETRNKDIENRGKI